MNYGGFVGGSHRVRSRTINSEWTVNLYQESGGGTPKRDPGMYIRPCLQPWTYCGPGPIRSLYFQDNRFFAVSGGFYYEIDRSSNVTSLGAVQQDAYPATISSNGTGGFQNFITSGGLGYIHDLTTNAFVQISDADFPNPVTFGAYVDGYFVALKGQSNQFQISALEDGLTWDGLDVAQASLSSDQKVALVISHRELWLHGTQYTEVWYNSGDASFPFQPVQGVFIEHGIAAPYSAVRLDNTQYWVGQDEAGRGIVWRANGYTPERVSDHALENQLQALPRLDDMRGVALQMDGHAWYLLYSPHLETSPVYDVGGNLWTDWGHWSDELMRFIPFVGTAQASGWGMQFIGDRQSGTIYTLSMSHYQDRLVNGGGL